MWQYNFLVTLPLTEAAHLIHCYSLNPPTEASASSILHKLFDSTSLKGVLNVKIYGFFSVLLLTSLHHLKYVVDYSLVGPSLDSAPVHSVTFHFLLCLFLLPSFFFSSPFSLMILLASSATAFKIYLLVLKRNVTKPLFSRTFQSIEIFFLINWKSIVESLISQTAGLFSCLKSTLPFCHFLSHTPTHNQLFFQTSLKLGTCILKEIQFKI